MKLWEGLSYTSLVVYDYRAVGTEGSHLESHYHTVVMTGGIFPSFQKTGSVTSSVRIVTSSVRIVMSSAVETSLLQSVQLFACTTKVLAACCDQFL